MAKQSPSIPDSELDVLKVLWDRGRGTVREVLDALKAAGHLGKIKGKPWSYATVATLLDRLEQRGLVSSDRRELAFVYTPTVAEQDVRRERIGHLVDKLYEGEPGLLVLHLLQQHRLAPEHAKEVRALLERLDAESEPPARG
ncbi:BlaI/MecI/CopY family transcriptional regulator [Tautonia sociabilis]|uniref:CopY family transcriptional repressor n=1 Tax=Tautonia sociabilis TaxID=2080755 RepID=A0A432MPV7_9BACT|nr:BlaI/MecI/CopY family transcriptional regulator [Tautonia sociabilis]RUL89187.1 CopY family transcriptional repressor [Tautonia sociabilis]